MLEVKVPATSANLGCGFDSLGIALDVYNTFIFRKNDNKNNINIKVKDNNIDQILDISLKDNLIYKSLQKLYNKVGHKFSGIEVVEHTVVPLARGLGSSATAIIGALVGGNQLLGNPLDENELLDIALEIEHHPDNIVPAMVGGLTISLINKQKLCYKKINISDQLNVVLIIPDFELKTKDLRQVLPEQVSRENAVFNHSRTALLIASVIDCDWGNLALAMEDKIHQDYRGNLIPGFEKIFEKGYQAGARGIALSGAGPTILAFCDNDADLIAKSMKSVFTEKGIKSKSMITNINNQGVQVEEG